jgi:hypothetical protein
VVDTDGLGGRLRVALVPLGFALGAILCRIVLTHAPGTYAVDLAQPLAVVTYWQQFGLVMWISLFTAIAIASAGYIALLVRSRSTNLVTVVTFCALACAAALAFPVVFSSDAYAYAGYGWLALHGVSPYAHTAVAARDPLIDAILWQWGNPPPVCVYGPAFVWFSQAIVTAFQQLGPAAPLWAFRVTACAALVLCAPLAFVAFPETTRASAAAGIALNPIAIWCCAEGHNDVYILALALGSFALIARGRAFAGAAVLALSALVKIPVLFAAAAAPIAYARDTRFARVLAGAAAGLAICALAGEPALAQLTRDASQQGHYYFPQFSLQFVLRLLLRGSASLLLTGAIVAACAVAGAILAWKRRESGLPLLGLALWLAIPNPYPWYVLWILPLAFVRTGAAGSALVALTLCSVLRYLPDSTTDISPAASVFVALAPLAAAAIAFIFGSRRPQPLAPVVYS